MRRHAEDEDSLCWTTIDLKVDAWCHIWNFRYGALRGKAEGESSEVLKDISIVDQGGGRRTVDLVLVGKTLSPEVVEDH
jgi:hypothetical protein